MFFLKKKSSLQNIIRYNGLFFFFKNIFFYPSKSDLLKIGLHDLL
jgi:hypothetical protein